MENLGTDWLNNLIFLVSDPGYKLTPWFQTALKMYKSSMKKYNGYKFELLGHSQSGVIVNNLCSDKVRNCISLNPAYKNASLKNNEYTIRSTVDVVSKLTAPKKALNSVLYPQWTKKHMVSSMDWLKMVNQWIDFVRKYAKDNNLSYGCAISQAGPAYRSIKKGGNPKQEKKRKGWW